ncbi:MAG: glycosyltransferase family 4 protein [Pyrinomonadaceae bacterium]
MQPTALYICYFWLDEPLVQTQVLPYLREIQKGGARVALLTFEKENLSSEKIETERKRLADDGITWHCLRYHKTPSVPATFFDILNGARFVRGLNKNEKFDILHGRVHLPTLMAAIARKLSKHKPKILFDIRGFFPEEYTDGGVWPEGGWLYRAAKRVERWLLKEADGFVVLTEKARDIIFPESKTSGVDKLGRPVEVIPCCVDLKRFDAISDESRAHMRSRLNIGDRFVIAYVGSFGGWYLTDEMFEFFSAAREADPSVFIMVLTQRDKAMVIDKLTAAGFGETDFFADSVSPSEIQQYLNAADAGLSFIKRCYSKQSSSPTKNAEYLAAGLPIVANAGVGDVDLQITEHNVGVLVERFDRECYLDALERLKTLGNIRERCREVAKTGFDLETIGGTRYRRLYERILGQK